MLGGVHGMDKDEVYRELCEVVAEWLEIIELPGKTAVKTAD